MSDRRGAFGSPQLRRYNRPEIEALITWAVLSLILMGAAAFSFVVWKFLAELL